MPILEEIAGEGAIYGEDCLARLMEKIVGGGFFGEHCWDDFMRRLLGEVYGEDCWGGSWRGLLGAVHREDCWGRFMEKIFGGNLWRRLLNSIYEECLNAVCGRLFQALYENCWRRFIV